jgi:hypothetical protein
MSRTKSLIAQVVIDCAGRAHNCQANSSHRINKGDKRLNVKNGMGWDRYCWECALKILARDIEKLTSLQNST